MNTPSARAPLQRGRRPLGWARPICRTLRFAAILGTLVLAAGPAATQEPTRAAKLFDRGRAALEQGRLDEACALLAESQQIEPRVGTLLNWADCEERRGQLLAASDHWVAARDLARSSGDPREAEAKNRFEQLEGRIPRLTVRLPADTPPGTSVTRSHQGGEPVDLRALGKPERVDPGRYRVVVSAPGHRDRAYELELLAGESNTLAVAVGPGSDELGEADAAESGWSNLNSAGAVLGGVGLVSVIVGAVFGAKAISKKDEAEAYCDAENWCDQQGVDLRDEGLLAARVSTGTVVVGTLLLATGIVLVAIPSSGSEGESVPGGAGRNASSPSAWLGLGPAGLRLGTRW